MIQINIIIYEKEAIAIDTNKAKKKPLGYTFKIYIALN